MGICAPNVMKLLFLIITFTVSFLSPQMKYDVAWFEASEDMYMNYFHDITANFSKQIHWYKNTVLGDEFTTESTSLVLVITLLMYLFFFYTSLTFNVPLATYVATSRLSTACYRWHMSPYLVLSLCAMGNMSPYLVLSLCAMGDMSPYLVLSLRAIGDICHLTLCYLCVLWVTCDHTLCYLCVLWVTYVTIPCAIFVCYWRHMSL